MQEKCNHSNKVTLSPLSGLTHIHTHTRFNCSSLDKMLHIVSNSLQRVAFTFPLLFAVHTGTINLFLHWQITHTSCSLTLFLAPEVCCYSSV